MLLFVNYSLQAQHPVYTQLTEKDGLPDIEFYDLIEDKEGFIWLAADKGLFRYDGKEFKNYTHPNKINLSVFGLKFDEQGRLWCNNIAGQFFYVENDKLHLFEVEVKADAVLTDFLFYHDFLWINTYKYSSKINLKTSKKTLIKQTLFEKQYIKEDTLFFLRDKKLSFTTDNINFQEKLLINSLDKYPKIGLANSFLHDDKIFHYGFDFNKKKDKACLLVSELGKIRNVILPKELEENRVINVLVQDDFFWFCTTDGVYVYVYKSNSFILKKTYFEGKQITKVLKDRNDNYWFSTLRNGVFIISNIYIEKHHLRDTASNISVMKSISDNEILLGSTKGDLIKLNKRSKKINYIYKKERQKVFSISSSNENAYISFGQSALGYHKKTKTIFNKDFLPIENAKGLVNINEDKILQARYNSAQILNLKENTFKNIGNKRSYSVHFSKNNNQIYVGYIDGLKFYNKQLKESTIAFNNKPIFAINIEETNNGIIWVSTFKDGVIGVDKDRVVVNYTTKNGLLSNETSTIKADGNLLWIVTNKSIQVLNTETKEFKNLTPKDGITTFNITDIVPAKNTIFFSSNKGLFEFNREKVFKKRTLSDFYIKTILIDDKLVLEKDLYGLDHTTKKVEFNFHTNGFLSEDNIKYQYRLLGASEKWQTVPENVGLVTFNNLASGKYVFELKAIEVNGNGFTNTKSIQINIKSPFFKQWWFVLLSITFVGFVIWKLFRLRLKKIKEKQKIAIEKERIQKQLVSSKLESLQSQMNPHFTFNALNSIQNLVLKGNKYEAYDYLNKFSVLIRENLNMSRKSYVAFDEELQMLTRYLELEQLRFQDNFEYLITGDKEIGDIKIPTLIIQPYIENAIKHGLLHKNEGEKKLRIHFIQEDVLKCIITDNGVGIVVSKKIKEQNGIERDSFSTSAIKDRMRFLRDYYKTDIGVVYEDIPIGTKVIIKIPFTR